MEYYYCRNNYSNSVRYLLFDSKIKMTKQISKRILFFVLVFTSLILVFAFVIEHQLGHEPCKLCLYERIPYFFSVFLLLNILFIKRYEKITLLVLSLVFIGSTILAFYHFGIEQGFFNESIACATNNLTETLSKEQLLEELKQNSISCKDVSFKILGLSLAAINTIFSLVLSFIFIRLFLYYKKI